MLKIVTAPLQEMCNSGIYKWGKIHQEAWNSMKMLCSLKFSNSVVDQSRHLFVACDSSQIALGVICFQLADDGEILLISTDCKILKQADRNRASAFRELLALLYSVIALETEICMHKMSVVVLTDAISLSLLYRQKYTNSRLSNPKTEFLDCFGGSSIFSQNKTRYFNLKAADLQTNVPRELNFLANFYAGWNSEKLTQEQFDEAEEKLQNFPAAALAKKCQILTFMG